MSGIFGYYKKYSPLVEEQDMISRLSRWNRQYGTDAAEIYRDDHWGIGCHAEHLSDRMFNQTPILRENGKTAAVDAILFNREELLEENADAECSDEAVLLQLIRQKGMNALCAVNGDFAGAIYDEQTGNWILFRDHLGVRPLYYCCNDRIFAFSTDLRGLAALQEADLKINQKKLYLRMLGYNDLTIDQTEYSNIRCVPPGSWIEITENGSCIREHRYWQLKQQKIRMKRDRDYQQALKELVTDAIRRRLDVAPGLIGCELSGGLDSGVIAILINRLGREERCFSWSVAPEILPLQEGDDERKIIRDICSQENIRCDYCNYPDIPVSDDLQPAFINTPTISRTAAHFQKLGARVIFTGHGGDEGVSHRMGLPELWKHREYGAFLQSLWETTENQPLRLLRTGRRMIRHLAEVQPELRKPYHNVECNSERFLLDSFKEKMSQTEKTKLYFAYFPHKFVEQGGVRLRLDNLAAQSADYGVRYMIPYLDHRVIDFAVSIPRRLYRNGKVDRWIFREAFREIMPDSLYRMQYKDTASQRDRKPEGDVREEFLKQKEAVVSGLDRTFWKEILNFEEIDRFTLSVDFTIEEFTKAVFALDDLIHCCRIRTVMLQTKGEQEND